MTEINMKEAIPLKKYKLKNGLKLVISQRKNAPVVCLNLAYRVGSSDESAGLTGFAHLFEHLMFEGSRHVPKGSFDRFCSMAGGTNNAYTSYDYTSYNMTLPAHQLELGLWLESDRMFYFDILESALQNQQSVVVEEINQTVENTPYGRWHETLVRTAFTSESSYSWAVHGKKEDVAACKLENASSFFENFYRPDNAVLSVCGNVNPKEVLAKVEEYFGEDLVNKKQIDRRQKYLPSQRIAGVANSVEDRVPHSAVFVAYHCPGFRDDMIDTAQIISTIAGGGKSSRLHKNLVYKQQKAAQTGAFVDQREDTSLLVFYAIAADESINCDELNDLIQKETGKIRNGSIVSNEIKKAKNMLAASAANELQYNSGIADSLAFETLFFDEPERVWQYLERINSVKHADINRFANDFLGDNNSVRVDVVPLSQ